MTNYLYLIIGRSGAGKNTIVDELCKRYGYTKVRSYTTRQPLANEASTRHIYSDIDTYYEAKNSEDIAAETKIRGDYYWATHDQINNADFYIIDIEGIHSLKRHYKGSRPFKVIYIETDSNTCFNRMIQRLDDPTKEAVNELINRQHNDAVNFPEDRSLSCLIDYEVFNNNDLQTTVDTIYTTIISRLESQYSTEGLN